MIIWARSHNVSSLVDIHPPRVTQHKRGVGAIGPVFRLFLSSSRVHVEPYSTDFHVWWFKRNETGDKVSYGSHSDYKFHWGIYISPQIPFGIREFENALTLSGISDSKD